MNFTITEPKYNVETLPNFLYDLDWNTQLNYLKTVTGVSDRGVFNRFVYFEQMLSEIADMSDSLTKNLYTPKLMKNWVSKNHNIDSNYPYLIPKQRLDEIVKLLADIGKAFGEFIIKELEKLYNPQELENIQNYSNHPVYLKWTNFQKLWVRISFSTFTQRCFAFQMENPAARTIQINLLPQRSIEVVKTDDCFSLFSWEKNQLKTVKDTQKSMLGMKKGRPEDEDLGKIYDQLEMFKKENSLLKREKTILQNVFDLTKKNEMEIRKKNDEIFIATDIRVKECEQQLNQNTAELTQIKNTYMTAIKNKETELEMKHKEKMDIYSKKESEYDQILEKSVSKQSLFFYCPICFTYPTASQCGWTCMSRDPNLLSCGHLLCRTCLNSTMKTENNNTSWKCPICRKNITQAFPFKTNGNYNSPDTVQQWKENQEDKN